MAAVFLARDNVLQIERAIKVLKPEYMVPAKSAGGLRYWGRSNGSS